MQDPAIPLTKATAGCCECLDANVVRTGGLLGANAVPNYVQIAPGDDAIDQPLTAAIFKIRFVEAQPHKGPYKEDNILPQRPSPTDGPIHATRQYLSLIHISEPTRL